TVREAKNRETIEIYRDVIRCDDDHVCVLVFGLQIPGQLVAARIGDRVRKSSSGVHYRLIDQRLPIGRERAKRRERQDKKTCIKLFHVALLCFLHARNNAIAATPVPSKTMLDGSGISDARSPV